MKRLILILLAIVCFQCDLSAQQDANYTAYMYNGLVLNPAYAGTNEAISAMAYYRYQWANIETAPRTLAISGHGRFARNAGLGIYIENDQIGVHNRMTIKLSYAYRLRVGDKGNLSLGIQGGFLNYTSNFNEIEFLPDEGDDLLSGDQSRFVPNFGAGLFYYTDRFYLGLSVPHIINNALLETEDNSTQKQHFFLNAGAVFATSRDFRIRPSFMLRAVPGQAPLSLDLNVNFIIREAMTIGISHRLSDSMSFILAYQFNKNLRAGYAYDYPISDISYLQAATHDFFIGYDFGFDNDKVLSPRFF